MSTEDRLASLKNKVSRAVTSKRPTITLDMSLADKGNIEAEQSYGAKIHSARFVLAEDRGYTNHFFVTSEVLDGEGQRVGVISDKIYTSAAAIVRLRDFLVSCGLEEESKSRNLDPYGVAEKLPNLLCVFNTSEITLDDDTTRVVVCRYLVAEERSQWKTSNRNKKLRFTSTLSNRSANFWIPRSIRASISLEMAG